MHTALAALALFLGSLLHAADLEERIDIDPAVQGVWFIIGSSDDKGVTLTPINTALVRVDATRVLVTGGQELTMKRCMIGTTDDGSPCNIVSFNNTDAVWCISGGRKVPGLFLVQFFRPNAEGTYVETTRQVFRVQK